MQTFISKTISKIYNTTKSFENVVFILPSQRAKVFVKHALKDIISVGFLPEILNIEEFIEEVATMKKADSIELLFHLYTIYKDNEDNPDSFDVFSSWAFTVIQDFNEIDQHLINTNDIFTYIRDIQRLRKWSVKGTFEETDLIKDYHRFLEKLNEYYTIFYLFLVENQIGYQGIIYREATKKLTNYLAKNHSKTYFFIGFNALNKAEEFIFKKMLTEGKATAFWDIDKQFLESNHQAGNFIRKYISNWKHYQENELNFVENYFSQEKKINIIGAAKNITQIKYAGEILSNLPNHNNTALVLADESLLPIALNSLPENVNDVNITMGYPLKNIPTTNLFFLLFQLFLSQEKLQKRKENLFYYKDVIRFIKQPIIYKLLTEENPLLADVISLEISKNNNTFVSQTFLNVFLSKLPTELNNTLKTIFNPFININDFLNRTLSLIDVLKKEVNPLEKEFLFRYFTIFTQLQDLQKQFGYFESLKTLHQFFLQLIGSENLSFQGEPLRGLQLMGMLETRVLDFENIILVSANEGILPSNTQQNSFIPFDVKTAFGLPTYHEKDAIFSYHFFRLLQRAKNIYILYNTETDSFGKGEKSRFVTQLELITNTIPEKIISPKIITEPTELKKITKDENILAKLKELASKGISPSALNTYLYNPIKFYEQKILKLKELNEVEETIATNTMGTVVHDVLEDLYKPFVGKYITISTINEMQKRVTDLTKTYFIKHFKNGDITTGKNRLIFEVAIRFVQNFLKQEKELLQNNELKIIATEQNFSSDIHINGIDFPIKIHGQIDRVDELNGIIRIIDYKTGMVKDTDLKMSDFTIINDYKFHKAIQVMLYAFMYVNTRKIDLTSKQMYAGVISFKNLKSGFLPLNFSDKYRGKNFLLTHEYLNEFMEEIKVLLQEIYNIEIPFTEPKELAF